MAPHEVVGSPILARAIDNFNLFFGQIKKVFYTSNFLIQTLVSSSLNTQTRLSPFLIFNLSAISWGIVVFNESDLVVLNPVFVMYAIFYSLHYVIKLVILYLFNKLYINY